MMTLHVGICEFDESYQIICSHYYTDQPLAPLSFYLANIWTVIFGDNVMSYRYFTYLMITLTIAIPTLYYYRRVHKSMQSAFIFFILQLSYNMFMPSIFNWDVCSNMFIVSVICAIFSYCDTHNAKKLILLALLSSCATFCRIPNISLLPIIVLVILYVNKSYKIKLVQSIIYLSFFILFSFTLIYAIWGGVSEYISSWNSNNIISGHSSILSLFAWINGAPQRELPCFFMAVSMFAIVYALRKHNRFNKRGYYIAVTLFWWGYLSLIAFTQKLPAISSYQVGVFYLLIALAFLEINRKPNLTFGGGNLPIVLLIVLSYVPAIGSDNGSLKQITIPVIPIILIAVNSFSTHTLNVFLRVLSVTILMYYPIHKYRISNFDYGIQKATVELNDINKLSSITTTPEQKNKIETIYNNGLSLKQQGINTLYIGTAKYLYDYILENGKGYSLQEFHTPTEDVLIKHLTPIIDRYGAVCFLMEKNRIDRDYVNFLTWLEQKGYNFSISGKDYLILHRNDSKTNHNETDITQISDCCSVL